jgi:hypothetical protein
MVIVTTRIIAEGSFFFLMAGASLLWSLLTKKMWPHGVNFTVSCAAEPMVAVARSYSSAGWKQVSSLGTGDVVRLTRLRREEYWYFFRVLAFGSANPYDQHPDLASIGNGD